MLWHSECCEIEDYDSMVQSLLRGDTILAADGSAASLVVGTRWVD